MNEIRWHGRGGQGAKTVAQVLALAMLKSGRYVQAFPEYGPERSGAPLQAYTRVSDTPIRAHYGIVRPDVVVVLDESLIGEVEVTAGLKPDGLFLMSTPRLAEELSRELHLDCRVYAIDAKALAAEAGTSFGNVVMVGALAALQGEPSLDRLREAFEETFRERLSAKVIDGNLAAVEIGYQRYESERLTAASAFPGGLSAVEALSTKGQKNGR
jgi:pyruvate ferredoxin oxidoreductase gamma subunit